MIDQTDPGCDNQGPSVDPLDQLAPYFDVAVAQFGPGIYLCAAVPNDRALSRWPDFPRAAQPESGRIGTGCGIDETSCRRSGLGEAVELAASCFWGNEPLVLASAAELGAEAVEIDLLNGFTPGQLARRDAWNDQWRGYDWRPRPAARRTPRHWIEARDCATGRIGLLPAEFVLIGMREAGDEEAAAIADSNGCACGPTPDAARLSALLELIERDAVGRWWFGMRRRPNLPPEVFEPWPELFRHLTTRRRHTRLFDLTTDLAVPVVAAVSFEPDGSVVALGSAARASLAAAALAAAAEMTAVETSLPPWREIAADTVAGMWLREASAAVPPLDETTPHAGGIGAEAIPVEALLAHCIEAAERCGCRVFFVDLTRSCLGVPVFRAVSPELCHTKPRLGKLRLLAPDHRDLAPGRRSAAPVNRLFVPL